MSSETDAINAARYWKAECERNRAQFNSLRDCWNRAVRELNDPEIRLILAKKADAGILRLNKLKKKHKEEA